MGFSIVYGALLTKTNRISRIFHSASQSARRPSYISPKSQLIITAVLVSVQFLATLVWIVAAFPNAQKVYPQRSEVRQFFERGASEAAEGCLASVAAKLVKTGTKTRSVNIRVEINRAGEFGPFLLDFGAISKIISQIYIRVETNPAGVFGPF